MILRARNAANALVDLRVAASGKLEVENTTAVVLVSKTTLFTAQSVPTSSSVNSATTDGGNIVRARVFIDSSGADITVKLQASADDGTTWHDVATYVAGAVGVQAVIDLPGPLLRLRATNASAISAQSVTARIVKGSA